MEQLKLFKRRGRKPKWEKPTFTVMPSWGDYFTYTKPRQFVDAPNPAPVYPSTPWPDDSDYRPPDWKRRVAPPGKVRLLQVDTFSGPAAEAHVGDFGTLAAFA